jgi:hypothetical protein
MEVSSQFHTLTASLPIGYEVGSALIWSGRYREEKNLTLVGIRTPAIQPVAIPFELSRLLIHS